MGRDGMGGGGTGRDGTGHISVPWTLCILWVSGVNPSILKMPFNISRGVRRFTASSVSKGYLVSSSSSRLGNGWRFLNRSLFFSLHPVDSRCLSGRDQGSEQVVAL